MHSWLWSRYSSTNLYLGGRKGQGENIGVFHRLMPEYVSWFLLIWIGVHRRIDVLTCWCLQIASWCLYMGLVSLSYWCLQNLWMGAHTIGYWCLLAIYVIKDSIYIKFLYKYYVYSVFYVDNYFDIGVWSMKWKFK